MTDTINIQKNERGKIIVAELASNPFYSPSGYNNSSSGISVSSLLDVVKVKKLLSNHVKNAPQLRTTSDRLYNENGIYRRLIDTMLNMVSYEYVVVPKVKDMKKFNERSYELSQQKTHDYLWNCNLEITMDDIIFKALKYGRYSAFDRDKYLQPLPLDYTRIIGYASDGNAIIQFNYQYFDQFTDTRERNAQLNGFDAIFRKQFLDYKKGIDNPKENKVNELNWRTLPHEQTITVKIGSNAESEEGIGILYGSIDDVVFYDEVRTLDREIIKSQKRKIVVQEIPVDKNTGESILGEEEIIQAHQNLKGLVPSNVGVLTVLGGTKFSDIPLQLSALEKGKLQEVQGDVLLSSGVGDSALKGGNFSSGVLNIEVISNAMVKILKQIESLWFNRKFKKLVTHGNYQFKFKFLGITSFNRDKIIEAFDGLLDKGGNLSPSISARGFNINEYMDILTVEDALKYKDKFEPLMTSFTTSNKDGGRPSGSGEGGDNTDKSGNSGGNNSPSPSN